MYSGKPWTSRKIKYRQAQLAITESRLEGGRGVVVLHVVESQCAASLLQPHALGAVEREQLRVELEHVRLVLLARRHLQHTSECTSVTSSRVNSTLTSPRLPRMTAVPSWLVLRQPTRRGWVVLARVALAVQVVARTGRQRRAL